ncbi:MAG TPA: hypothetical protein VGK88_10135 [bacterium]|jgi:hypothetical protein
MIRNILLITAALVLVVGTVATAHQLETIPPSHWAYAALRSLAGIGLVSFRSLAQLPLTRGEIAALVQTADQAAVGRTLPVGTRELLAALRREFAPQTQPVRTQVTARVAPTRMSLTDYPGITPGSFAGLGVGAGGSAGVVWVEGGITPSGGQATRVYGMSRFGEVYLQIGREIQQWGPSPRTSLILSEWAGGIDMVRLVVDSGRFRFTKFASPLITGPRIVYFVGTRLDWQATERFRIGFSESILTFRGPMLAYALLNPLPVVLTEALDPTRLQLRFLRQTAQFVDAVDFDWMIRPGFTLAGQLLVDDYSSDGRSPHRIGAIGLFTWADPFRNGRTSLRVEYSAVNNYTYTDNKFPLFNYILPSGRFLGYWLGDDADDLVLELRHVLGPSAVLSGWLAHTRHGEGRIGIPMPPGPTKKFKNAFLSGIVEDRMAAGAQYETHDENRTVRYWGEVASIQNLNNKRGRSGTELLFGIEFLWRW